MFVNSSVTVTWLLFLLKMLFIYLTTLGLSCSTRDLRCVRWALFFFFFLIFIYLFYFLAVVGLRCCSQAFSSCGVTVSGGCSLLWCVGFSLRGLLLWHTGLVAPWHMGSSWNRDQTSVPCIERWILYHWTTREASAWDLFNAAHRLSSCGVGA